MRVLIVEDDSSIRETIAMVLEAYAYEADSVDCGEKVIDYLKKTWPDVVLLDLTLVGMSGEQVYQAILDEFGKAPPTVVLSAAQEGEKRASLLQGTSYLGKPYTIEQLIEVIERATSKRGAA